MSWVFDAPTGVYKDHALSSKIREEAAADTLFSRFVSPERGYGKGKGQSVTITRVMQLPVAGKVSELDRLPTGRPAIDTVSKTVSEWGFAIETTEFEENLTHFDLRNKFQRMLRDQMRITMDKMVADALKSTPLKAVGTGTSGSPTTAFDNVTYTGSPTIATTTNTRNIQIADLREIHDRLRGDNKAPGYRNGKYVGILSTKAARGIKSDSEYKDWLSPTTAEPFISGRLKDVEGFALFECNNFDALDNSIQGGNTGEALFFGDDGGFLATVQDPELRAGLPEDLGRFRKVGWVGTLEAGLTWTTQETARVCHWSAAGA